jgi:hypothetical protein
MIRYFRHKTGFGDGTAFVRVVERDGIERVHTLQTDGSRPELMPQTDLATCRFMVQKGYWVECSQAEARSLCPRALTSLDDFEELRELARVLEGFFCDGVVVSSLLTKERMAEAEAAMRRMLEVLP